MSPEDRREPGDVDADVARRIIGIMLTADNECHDCGGKLLEAFAKAFPAHRDLAVQMYADQHPGRDLSDYDSSWQEDWP